MYVQVAQDPEFTLRIKGKRPEEYPWMHKRPEEVAWYRECFERIDAMNPEHGRDLVRFDAHGDDTAQWYREIGYGLSVSDHESFHLTLPDAAASGWVPVSLGWPGADLIYPRDWFVATLDKIVERILAISRLNGARHAFVQRAADFVGNFFDDHVIFDRLDRTLRG